MTWPHVPEIVIPALVTQGSGQPIPCRAEIDTGASRTLAGGYLGEALLLGHQQQYRGIPVPVPFSAADGRPFVGFPVSATVQVPVGQPVRFVAGDPMPTSLTAVNTSVYVGMSISLDGGGYKYVHWDECDMLVGRDLISMFRLTVEGGMTTLETVAP